MERPSSFFSRSRAGSARSQRGSFTTAGAARPVFFCYTSLGPMIRPRLRSPCVGLLALVALLCAGACADDDVPKLVKDKPAGAPTARFRIDQGVPDYLEVPFPSDVYLSAGKYLDPIPGMDKVVVGNSKFLTYELARLNGFSRIAMALFYVDDAAQPSDDDGVAAAKIDGATLPVDEAACVSDADGRTRTAPPGR